MSSQALAWRWIHLAWPLVWLLACSAPPQGDGEGVLVAEVEIDEAVTRVRETLVWQGGRGDPSRELELNWIEGAFPLRPAFVLEDATLDGTATAITTRRYDDWLDLDFPGDLPANRRHQLELRYALSGAWARQDDRTWVLTMQQVGPDSRVAWRNVSLRVVAPAGTSLGLWVAPGYTEYDEVALRPDGEASEARQVWVATLGPSSPGDPMFWKLGVNADGFRPTYPPYLATLVEQTGIVPWALGVVLLLALALRALPARATIAGTRLLHAGLLAVAAWEVLGGQLHYWWGEAARGGASLPDAFAEVAASFGLLVILGAFLWAQERGLRARRPEAYVLELALPVALCMALPMISVRSSYLLLPLLGLPGLVAWSRRPVALAMGADLHRLVEAVQTRGSVAVDVLAADVGLRPDDVRVLLEQHPSLPLVFERDEGIVLSASAAALREDLRVCPSCGGGTRISGQDRVACPYCERQYASARTQSQHAPVPLLVRSVGALLKTLGRGLVAWAVLLSTAFALMSLLDHEDKSFIAALIVAAIMIALAYGSRAVLVGLSERLAAGRGYVPLLIGCGLAAWLVVPGILAWRLRSPRVRLHFGRFDLEALSQLLQRRGELTLDELARELRTSWDEVFDLAIHLCGTGQLDAVLDRAGLRIVARSRLRELARAGTCHRCGGIVAIMAGTVRCHHCGTEPDTPERCGAPRQRS